MQSLLTPREIDLMLGYPAGRTMKLIKAGKIPKMTLPDDSIRVAASDLEDLLTAGATVTIQSGKEGHQ